MKLYKHFHVATWLMFCKLAPIGLFFLMGAVLQAQHFPSLEAAPQAYEYALRDTQRNTQRNTLHNDRWRELAEMSLWASSVNAGPGAEEKAAAYLERINAAAAELAAADLPQDARERGEYVLTFLHRRFLKSYSARQTRVDEILVSGRYNCVSSAVLYMVLGLSVGLDVEGVVTKDHAFATVNTGTERIDVETTNQYGFDPGNRKEFHDAFGKTTGFVYTPAQNYRDRMAINGTKLVSLILSNRISVLDDRKQYAEAIPLAINRAVLLSSSAVINSDLFPDPQQDMMKSLYNLGVHFIQTGKEDDAIAWAVYAGERFPHFTSWQELFDTAANNKIAKLVRTKKPSEARSALTVLQPKLSGKMYLELETVVVDTEAVAKVYAVRNPGDAEAVLAWLEQVGEHLQPQRRDEIQTTVILNEAERLRKANWYEAMRWLEGSIQKYGANTKLEAALHVVRQNRVSELHNEFAYLYNKKEYKQAKVSIQRSLQEFPGERTLVQDFDMVEKALGE